MRIGITLLFWMITSLATANEVAVVIRSSGEVVRTNVDEVTSEIKRRDSLSEGDRVKTGENAYLTIKFSDQSIVDLGNNTELAITRYQPTAEDGERKIILELLSGQLRTITGKLAKEPTAFELRTAHASIGVRGTEFEVHWVSAEETQVLWHDGVVEVASKSNLSDILELNENTRIASVNATSAPVIIGKTTLNPLGKFASDLLETISSISLSPLTIIPALAIQPITAVASSPVTVPILAPLAKSDENSAPLVVPLFTDGSTPTDGDENLEPIEALVDLVNSQQWQSARLLADELKVRFEGLPRFDLYFGLLLVAEGNFDEAIFTFERVLMFSPTQHRARLELGRAYYLLNNYSRARDSLNQVLDYSPPANVRSKVKLLLNQIDIAEKNSKTQLFLNLGITAGWDSNTNQGSSLEGTLDPNLLGLTTLSDVSGPLSSAFTQLSVNASIYKPTSLSSHRVTFVDFTNKNFIDINVSDTTSFSLGNHINAESNGWRAVLPTSVQMSWLENSLWQTTVDGSLRVQRKIWGPLWAGVKIGTQLGLAIDDANVSTVNDLAGIQLDVQERGRVHTFNSTYLQTMLAGDNDEHQELRGIANQYQLMWNLPFNVTGTVNLQHQWHRYKAEDLFFTENSVTTDQKLRQDQVLNIDLAGSWSPNNWLQARTQLSWELIESNINAYSRNQLIVSQAVNIQF